MKLPTDPQLDTLLDELRLTDKRTLRAVLLAALTRDRAGGPVVIDGYPASTLGGARGSADPMRLTSVEAAALTDPDSAAGDDPIHTTLRRCLSIAERMRDSRHDLERAVHDLAQIMGILGNPPPPTCEILVGEPVDRTSDFGGLLPRPYRVCRPVVDFVYTRERLPTETEREEYRRYGVWQRRVRVLP